MINKTINMIIIIYKIKDILESYKNYLTFIRKIEKRHNTYQEGRLWYQFSYET